MTPRPFRQAHPASRRRPLLRVLDAPEDGPWEIAVVIGTCVFAFLWIYVMSGAELVWPVPR